MVAKKYLQYGNVNQDKEELSGNKTREKKKKGSTAQVTPREFVPIVYP